MVDKSKKRKRQELKKLVQKSLIREEEIKRIKWGAASSIQEVLLVLGSSFIGLDEVQVRRNKKNYGENETEEERKKNWSNVIFSVFHRSFFRVVRQQADRIFLPSKDIVVGDIVFLQKGDLVPADLRVMESENLKVDQTILEEEESVAEKNAGICHFKFDQVTQYPNIILKGTKVVEGSGKAVALSVGSQTIYGTKEEILLSGKKKARI